MNQNNNIRDGLWNHNPDGTGHERVVINGGTGNDTIKFWGEGAVVAEGGEGNDVIFVSQVPSSSARSNAVWALNIDNTAEVTDRLIYWDGANGAQPLNNAIQGGPSAFSYTVAATGSATAIAAGAELAVNINFLGFTGTASLGTVSSTAGTYSFTADQINEAIAKAVADSPTLKHVLAVKDGAGHSLLIESLINHWTDLTSLSIGFTQQIGTAAATALTATSLMTAINAAYVTPLTTTGAAYAVEATPVGTAIASYYDYMIDIAGITVTTNSYYGVMIDGVMYSSTTATTGTTDNDLLTALRAATDGTGKLLTDNYNVSDFGSAGSISIASKDGDSIDNAQLYVVDPANPSYVDGNGADILGAVQANNIVEGGAGNDVILLNATGFANRADLVRLSGAFGDDSIFNFDAKDGFDVTSLLKINLTDTVTTNNQVESMAPVAGRLYQVEQNATYGAANGVMILEGGAHVADGGSYAKGYTEAEVRTRLIALDNGTEWGTAGQTSLYFIKDVDVDESTDHYGNANLDNLGTKYTVVQVVEGGDGTLSAADTVNVLGTITLEDANGGVHNAITIDQLYVFA